MNCPDCGKDCSLCIKQMSDCVGFYWQGCTECWQKRDLLREQGKNWKFNGGPNFKVTDSKG